VSNFARTDIFGNLKNPSGFNLYQRLNNNVLTFGEEANVLPPQPVSTDQFSNLVLTAAAGTPALSLALDIVVGASSGVKVFATPPLSPGVDFVKSEYRLIDTDSSVGPSPINLLTLYTAKFGSIGTAGQKIFVKLVPCGFDTGIEGTAVTASAIIAA
jgi:hypothetical protein